MISPRDSATQALSVLPASPRSALELRLLASLFASLVCSAMAMRYYNHTGFVLSLPVGSEVRARHLPLAITHVRHAGLMYSWGLRLLLFVGPIVVGLLDPRMMPGAALVLIAALADFDRT